MLDRETLQKRLLLCLLWDGNQYGSQARQSRRSWAKHNELIYTRRRYINQEHLRAAIIDVANAIFQVRQPHIWGEGTTTCASDSTQFGSWDQNLMTEWHLRYGGKGVMIYWHVEKHATCIYSQLKTCSSSEVAAMIKGVLRHCTQMKVEKAIRGYAWAKRGCVWVLPSVGVSTHAPAQKHLCTTSRPTGNRKTECLSQPPADPLAPH